MSREIKFRAWDKTYNFMSYKVLVGNTDTTDENYTAHCIWVDSEKVDYKRVPGWMNFDELSDVVLMQYTGLKVNGKEIYEGDILELYIPNWAGYDDVQRFVVNEFCSDVTYLQAVVKHCEECSSEGESDYIEVIGNIYEHSHLLEATA